MVYTRNRTSVHTPIFPYSCKGKKLLTKIFRSVLVGLIRVYTTSIEETLCTPPLQYFQVVFSHQSVFYTNVSLYFCRKRHATALISFIIKVASKWPK